jgi:Sulfotransferase family
VQAAFVDMDPLKATRLPMIARLFPAAKILIMRRDPRDVVWSCFKTNFTLTNSARDFATLEGAARHYAALMELTELARAKLDLAFHEVRYEALVRDFDTETQAMCQFAGLNWSEDLRKFDKTAKQRGVSTASAGQVRRGLYDGSGQWKPYARYFEPVLPILAPWIERYGYT